jgi:hypothetical protein
MTASASLGTIVVSNENNDNGLTTRQGATFDDDDEYNSLTTRQGAAFDRKETT